MAKTFIQSLNEPFVAAQIFLGDGREISIRVHVDQEGDPDTEWSRAALELLQEVTTSVYESGLIQATSGKGCIGGVEG